MEKSKEEVSVCGISESTVNLNENGARETLEESVHCASQGQVEGLGGEDAGGGSDKDIMVEVLGSDVYIDGVCTRSNEAELHDEVACGDGHNDGKPSGGDSGVGNEAEAGFEASHLQSSEAKGENATAQHDGAALDREEVSSATLKDDNVEGGEDVANLQGAQVLNNGAEKEEMGTGVSDSSAVVNSTLEETEFPMVEDVRLEHKDTQEAAAPDDKLTNPSCDNASGGLTGVSSLNGENVRSESVEKDNQQQRNLLDRGAREGGNDMALKSCDQQKKIANGDGDKILKKEACIYDKDENMKINATDEKLQSAGEQPMDIDKVGENSSSPPKVVAGGEAAVDKDSLNSGEKCVMIEKSMKNKMIPDTSHVSCDTGQGMEIDKHSPSESLTLLGRGQNSENYETAFSSMNRDAQVCNVGEISSIKGDDGVIGCVLSERPQNSEHSLEMDTDGDPALVNSGSREQGKLDGNVSDVKHVSLHKGKGEEAEDQSARMNRGRGNANIEGASVSFGVVENNLEVNTNSRSVENNQTADGGISSMCTAEEKSNDEVPLSADDQKLMSVKHVNQNMTSNDQVESNVRQTIEAQLGDIWELADSHVRQEMEVKEYNSDDHHNSMDEKAVKHMAMKPGSSGGFCQANSILPHEKEGDFSVSDMVWGKVRSHPWWPGQIFDPSDASERAMKHHKKDCFLVAYFGDRTFAWNEASQLKPFRAHFSNIEKQSNSELFQNAVDCAIDEVSSRVEFGLACSCVPKDIYDEIKFQTVENAGIREEICLRYGLDESLNVNSFSPNKLLEYLENLSQCPTGGFDRLELGIAKAQLLAFYRLKGYSCLPEFQYCGGLDCDIDNSIQDVENNASEDIQHEIPQRKDADQSSAGHRVSKGHNSSYHKRKHNLKDDMYPKKKEKSLSELIGGTLDSPDDYWLDEKAIDSLVSPTASKKKRTVDPYADDSGIQEGRKTISLAKVSGSAKPSFKIGECIRRVASQLTGSPTVRSSGERSQKPDENTDVLSGDISEDVSVQNPEEAKKSSLIDPTEYSSLNDLLSLLQWAAQDPLEHCNFLSVIVSFFSDFRNSIVVGNYSERETTPTNKVGAKRRKQPIAGSPETFEFEDMSDTYWTDRVIHNGSEEQPSKRGRKKENQSVPADPEKSAQVSRRPYSRKRYSDNINVEAPEKPSGYIDDKSPAELVMNFAELDSVPSVTNLNKMFRRFGPLKESETEVETMGSRARVVFKKCADAEVAFNSAKKFNIFGAILVNYQLNYTPSALFKASTVATTHDQEMHLDLSNFEVNMV